MKVYSSLTYIDAVPYQVRVIVAAPTATLAARYLGISDYFMGVQPFPQPHTTSPTFATVMATSVYDVAKMTLTLLLTTLSQ